MPNGRNYEETLHHHFWSLISTLIIIVLGYLLFGPFLGQNAPRYSLIQMSKFGDHSVWSISPKIQTIPNPCFKTLAECFFLGFKSLTPFLHKKDSLKYDDPIPTLPTSPWIKKWQRMQKALCTTTLQAGSVPLYMILCISVVQGALSSKKCSMVPHSHILEKFENHFVSIHPQKRLNPSFATLIKCRYWGSNIFHVGAFVYQQLSFN